jgi:hypothetical protein
MIKSNAKLLVALVLAAFSALFWLRNCQKDSPIEQVLRPRGVFLAEQTLTAVPEGSRALILTLGSPMGKDLSEPLLDGFMRVYRKHGVEIVAVEAIDFERFQGATGFPLSQFREAIEHHPEADAVVSLAGLPSLDEKDIVMIDEKGLRLILGMGDVPGNLPDYLDRGIVDLAITSRSAWMMAGIRIPDKPAEGSVYEQNYVVWASGGEPCVPEYP